MKLRRTLGRQPVTRTEPFEAQDSQAPPLHGPYPDYRTPLFAGHEFVEFGFR
jgi:hypothetical protein